MIQNELRPPKYPPKTLREQAFAPGSEGMDGEYTVDDLDRRWGRKVDWEGRGNGIVNGKVKIGGAGSGRSNEVVWV